VNRPTVPPAALGTALDALVRRYDRRWLASDPLRFPRRYDDPADREVAAVVAALLAYGRVASILASVAAVLEVLGPRPAHRLAETPPEIVGRRLRGFRHRWTRGSDVAWLLDGLRRIREEHGSLGALLLGAATPDAPLRSALAAWHDAANARRPATQPRPRGRAFLLPDPRAGGACKRLLLLARWCVRPDDGVDLGLWHGPSLLPADLLMPLDVHAHRIATQVGLTRRRRADWRAAEEVTDGLRAFAPYDPVRYDFALVRPGILGRCRYAHVADVCAGCDLREVCRYGRRTATT
jgi:uncharacterized protein (TIGR02757 family)